MYYTAPFLEKKKNTNPVIPIGGAITEIVADFEVNLHSGGSLPVGKKQLLINEADFSLLQCKDPEPWSVKFHLLWTGARRLIEG